MDIKEKIEELRAELHRHNYNYYVLNAPEISDKEFDDKMRELQDLEQAHPEYKDENSPTMRVGSDLNKNFTQVAHKYPMLSLANTYSEAEVTDRYTFENALYAYAMEKNKHITITKRGMYPEFVMDGVEYKAERNYTVIARIPTAVIRCTRKDAPEKEEKYRHGRKKWIRILRICWPAVTGTLLLIFLWGKVLFSNTEGRIALLAIMIVLLAMSVRNYLLYWNLD